MGLLGKPIILGTPHISTLLLREVTCQLEPAKRFEKVRQGPQQQDIKKRQRVVNVSKKLSQIFTVAFSIYMGLNMSRCIGQWMAMVKSSSPIFQQVKLVLSGSHWSCIRLEHNSSLRRQCGRGNFQLYYYLLLGGGFKPFLFSPLFGEDSNLTHIFRWVDTTN